MASMTATHDNVDPSVEEDFYAQIQWALAESHPGIRVEILGDEFVVNAAAPYEHDRLASALFVYLSTRLPDHLAIFGPSAGVYEADGKHKVQYFQPDVLIHTPPKGERLTGPEVEVAVEVLSPSNTVRRNYHELVMERATRYGVGWVLFIHPEERSFDLRRAAAQGEVPAYLNGVGVDTFDPPAD